MGFGGISPWSLLIILVIILLLFGTKRLRNMGGDLGGAFRSFKQSMKDDDKEKDSDHDEGTHAKKTTAEPEKVAHEEAKEGRIIDVEAKQKDRS